jgi:hypothetical protein
MAGIGTQSIWRYPVFATTIAFFCLFVAGCAHPRWERKSSERRAAIRSTSGFILDRKNENRSNLQDLNALHRTQAERRREHLRRRWGFVETRFEQEFVDWRDSREERREHFRRIGRGKPETIPDTWAELAF